MCKAIKNLFGIRSPSEEFVKDEPKDEPKDEVTEEVEEEAKPEEWIWVDGFKGMDKDMQAYDNFQYELDKQYDMPEGASIGPCIGGFHLCLNLRDVFEYYKIGNGNRFFQVAALVRKVDADEYGTDKNVMDGRGFIYHAYQINKLAARSIKIVRELTADEILKSHGGNEWDEKYKQIALSMGVNAAITAMRNDELLGLGYSLPFASWLTGHAKYEIAKAVGSQTDLSMDMKVLMIMNG